jgi:voltage-gated potassium channel
MEKVVPVVEDKLTILDVIVTVLSVYILGVLIIDTVYTLPKQTSQLLTYIDTAICAFFFVEFSIRFYKAESKLKFMRWGWIDLLSCIPMIGVLRGGRLIRLIRLIRIVRTFRSVRHLSEHIFENRAQGAFTSLFTISILLVIFSAIAILQVETDPASNIKTGEDAIWWAYVTITTVGYGDKFPVTTEGRVIAAVLMTAGVGLFGTFTAYIASWFAEGRRKKDEKSEL